MTFANFQDAVNAVLFYMDNRGVSGDVNSHFPVIVQGFMPTTVPWMAYSQPQRQHVMRCWASVWQLARAAHEVRLVTPAGEPKVRHLVLRQREGWDVMDFRTSKAPAATTRADRLVRDTMLATRRRVDATLRVEGCSVFFHARPDKALLPAFTAIRPH